MLRIPRLQIKLCDVSLIHAGWVSRQKGFSVAPLLRLWVSLSVLLCGSGTVWLTPAGHTSSDTNTLTLVVLHMCTVTTRRAVLRCGAAT